MSPWHLRNIARHINQGALIAYPTDTIWGFGCNPWIGTTIQRLQNLKQRSANKGLILLSPRLEYLEPFIHKSVYSKISIKQLTANHKATTWIIKASPFCPVSLTGNFDTIAIRISNIQPIEILCDSMQSALVSTSANISGFTTARNSILVHRHFQKSVDFIIEGFHTGSQQASEIRELESGKIIRS